MATGVSEISFNIEKSLKVPPALQKVEQESKPPNSPRDIFFSSVWSGIKGACATYAFVSASNHFFGLRPSIVWQPCCLAVGVTCTSVKYLRTKLNDAFESQKDSTKLDRQKAEASNFDLSTQLDRQKAEALNNEIEWRKDAELFVRSASEFGKSTWAGLGISFALYSTISAVCNFFNWGAVHPAYGIARGLSGLIGVHVASLGYPQTENLDPKLEGRIKTAVKSIFQGVIDGAALLSLSNFLVNLLDCRGYVNCRRDQILPLSLASVCLSSGSTFLARLRESKKVLGQEKLESSNYDIKINLKDFVNSILSSFVPFCVSAALMGSNHYGPSILTAEIITVTSSIIGFLSAIEKYYSSRYEVESEKRIRKRFIENIPQAFKTYTLSFAACIFYAIDLSSGKLVDRSTLERIITLSTIAGAAQMAYTLLKKPPGSSEESVLSELYQSWKRVSKVKKLGIFLTSIAALGVWYLGGPSEVYKQTAQPVPEIYRKLAFNTKSEHIVVSAGDYIKGLSPREEVLRLSNLGKGNLDTIPCAQILQTCDFNATEMKVHDKALRDKERLVSPYALANRNPDPRWEGILERARDVLNHARSLMEGPNNPNLRDNSDVNDNTSNEASVAENIRECTGQNTLGCTRNTEMLSVTRVFRTPRYFFEMLGLKLEPSCVYIIQNKFQQRESKRSLNDCVVTPIETS